MTCGGFSAIRRPGERRWVGIYGCEDPNRHHAEPSLSLVSSDAEAGRAGGEPGRVGSSPSWRVVIENHKAWDAATGVRRAWLREFFQRKTPPAGAAAFIAHAVLNSEYSLRKAMEQGHQLAVELFGVDGASQTDTDEDRSPYPASRRAQDLATLTDGATDKRLTLITLAVIMAAYENVLDRQAWRRDGDCAEKHYLHYLDALGYQLSDVEQLAAGIGPTGSDS